MRICFIINPNDNHSRKWVNYFEGKHNVNCIPIRDTNNKLMSVIRNVRLVRREIRKLKPDLLHAHYAGVNGILGALSGFHPFILTAHGSDIFENSKSLLKRQLLKYILKKADIITCNGKPMAEAMIKLGAVQNKIRFIYWGTDTKKFSPIYKTERNKIISLRNFEPVYDIGTLIRAIPFVLKKFPALRFEIAGIGSQEQDLKILAMEIGASKNIDFVGWIPDDEVPEHLNSADIYISTSLSDGDLAQSTQQAMACEIPIITTDIPVNKKRINDGYNGLIFPVSDFKTLSEKIIQLLKDKKLRNKLGINGRKTIKKELDYYGNMEKADRLYKELC